MSEAKISIQKRTKLFAIRVIKAYVEINKNSFNEATKVLSKQFLRSGTSIGANCAEANFAQSNNDFISKYSIALKEAEETRYWIELMVESGIVSEHKFSLMQNEIEQIIKILVSTIKTLKTKK